MGNDEMRVVSLPVEGDHREHDACQASQHEDKEEAKDMQHGDGETWSPMGHGCEPGKDLDAGRNRHQRTRDREEGKGHMRNADRVHDDAPKGRRRERPWRR